MSLQQIHDAIPHRAPFLLVDAIESRDERQIRCSKTFTGEEFWFAGHYPHFPVTPGVLLVEAAMQAGAILLSGKIDDAQGKVPVATRINNVRFKQMVRPGDAIAMEVELTDEVGGAYFLKAKVTVGGKLAAGFDFACMLVDPQ